MSTKSRHASIELVREGGFLAEIDVTEIHTDSPHGPCYDLADVERIDQARLALRRGDLPAACKLGRVYRLVPVIAS